MDIRRARAKANANKGDGNGALKAPNGNPNEGSSSTSAWGVLNGAVGHILPPGIQLPQPSSSSATVPSASSSSSSASSSSLPLFHGYPLSLQRFQQIRILGQGSFGIAYLVQDTFDEELSTFVIKRIDISSMDNKTKRAALGEVEVLARLSHPNICAYYGSWIEGNPPYLHILLEYCNGGDLQQAIKTARNNKKFFSESVIMTWFVQLSSAIYYCHNRRILHRDLKASNIFLQGPARIIKLADFGIARVLHSEGSMASTVIGTPYYMSPELCSNEQYSYKSDVWSLGCVLYEMCTLKHAFDAGNMCALVLSILRGKYPPLPSHYSSPLGTLVDSMLQLDPGRRPTMAEIIGTTIVQTSLKQTAKKEDHAGRKYFARAHDTLVQSVNVVPSSESQGDNANHKNSNNRTIDASGVTDVTANDDDEEEAYSEDDENAEGNSDGQGNHYPSLAPPSVHNVTHSRSHSLQPHENTNESDPGLMYAIDVHSKVNSNKGYASSTGGPHPSRPIPPSIRGAARQQVPNIVELENEDDNDDTIFPSGKVTTNGIIGIEEQEGENGEGVSYPDSQSTNQRSARPISSNPSEEDNTGWGTLNDDKLLSPSVSNNSPSSHRLMKNSSYESYSGLTNDSLGSGVATVGATIGHVTLPTTDAYSNEAATATISNASPAVPPRSLYVLPLAANLTAVDARAPSLIPSISNTDSSRSHRPNVGGARQALSEHYAASKMDPRLQIPKTVPFRASAPATAGGEPSNDPSLSPRSNLTNAVPIISSVQSPLRIVSPAQAFENRRLAHAQYEQKREQLRRKQMLMANRLRSPSTNVTSPETATPPNSVASSVPYSMESTPGVNPTTNDTSSSTSDGAFSISIDTNAVERILNHVAQSSLSTANGTAAALQVALARAAIAQGHISANQTSEFMNTQEANHHSELLQQAQVQRANIGMFALASNDQLVPNMEGLMDTKDTISVRIPGLPISPSSVPSSIDSIPSSSSFLASVETVPKPSPVVVRNGDDDKPVLASAAVHLALPPTLEQRQRMGVGLKRDSVTHLSNELLMHQNSLSFSQDRTMTAVKNETESTQRNECDNSPASTVPMVTSVTTTSTNAPKPSSVPSPRYSAQPLLARRFGQPPPPNHRLGMVLKNSNNPVPNGLKPSHPIHHRQLSNKSNGAVNKRIIAVESDSDEENTAHHPHHHPPSSTTATSTTHRIIGRKAGNASRRPTASDKLLAEVRDLQMVMAAAVAEAEQQKKENVILLSQDSNDGVRGNDSSEPTKTDTDTRVEQTVSMVNPSTIAPSNTIVTIDTTNTSSTGTESGTLRIDTSTNKRNDASKLDNLHEEYTDTDYDSDSTHSSFDTTDNTLPSAIDQHLPLAHHRRTSSLRAPGFRPLLFDARSVSISSGTHYTSSTRSIEIPSTMNNNNNDDDKNDETSTRSRERPSTTDSTHTSHHSLPSPRTAASDSPSRSTTTTLTPSDENSNTIDSSTVSTKTDTADTSIQLPASSDTFVLPLGTSFPSPEGPSIVYIDPRKGLQRSPLHYHPKSSNASSLHRALSGYAPNPNDGDSTGTNGNPVNNESVPLANRAIAMMNSVMERHIDKRKSFRSTNGSNGNLVSLVTVSNNNNGNPSVPSILTDISPNTTNVFTAVTPNHHPESSSSSSSSDLVNQAISTAFKASTPTAILGPSSSILTPLPSNNNNGLPSSATSVTGSRRSSWESKRLSWGQAQRELAAAATHLEIARNLREMLSLSTKNNDNNKEKGEYSTPSSSPLTDFTSPPPVLPESVDTNSSIMIHSSESYSTSSSIAPSSVSGEQNQHKNLHDTNTDTSLPTHHTHNIGNSQPRTNAVTNHSRLSTVFHQNGLPSYHPPPKKNNNSNTLYRNSPKALRRHSTGSSPMLILRSGSSDHLDSQRIMEVDNDDENDDLDEDETDDNGDRSNNTMNDDDDDDDNDNKQLSSNPSSSVHPVNSLNTAAQLEAQIRQRMDALQSYCITSLGTEKYNRILEILRTITNKTEEEEEGLSPDAVKNETNGPDPIAKVIQDIGPQLVMRLQLLLAYEEEAKTLG